MDYPNAEQHVQLRLVDRDVSLHVVEHSLVNFDWEWMVVVVYGFHSIKQQLVQTFISSNGNKIHTLDGNEACC